MGSIGAAMMRQQYPGKSDAEIAREIALKDGYLIVVGYRTPESKSGDRFTNFGKCTTTEQLQGYLTSRYCVGVEVLYDGRKMAEPATQKTAGKKINLVIYTWGAVEPPYDSLEYGTTLMAAAGQSSSQIEQCDCVGMRHDLGWSESELTERTVADYMKTCRQGDLKNYGSPNGTFCVRDSEGLRAVGLIFPARGKKWWRFWK